VLADTLSCVISSGVPSLRVWWTIRGSDEAWEWSPDGAVVRSGRLTAEGGALRFTASEEWAPMWTSVRTRASFQAFKDLTALFAEEANVLPGDVRIFWIAGERAVSWCRSTGTLWLHVVHDVTAPAVFQVEPLVGEARDAASDLRAADARARAVLEV
jgi:hypothetical protein